MDAEINNVIYMELYLGPKMAHGKYEKTNVVRFHCNSTQHLYVCLIFYVNRMESRRYANCLCTAIFNFMTIPA
jgi:hypothetical protein